MNRLAVLFALLVLAGCYYGDPGATADPDVGWSLIGLTPDAGDTLNVSGDLQAVHVTAARPNRGANTRIGWVVDGDNFEVNTVCATWLSRSGPIAQPGLVVHFDGTHAITVTQNIWMGARSGINFHAWDLSAPLESGHRFTWIGSFNPPGIGDGYGWPLRACARAAGPFLDAKIWPAALPEPEWGDPQYSGGSLIIDQPGRAGWYAGHIEPGGDLTMVDLVESHW